MIGRDTLHVQDESVHEAPTESVGRLVAFREVDAPVNHDAYVSLKLLADHLGLQPGTIRNWRYRGWLDAQGKRRHVRVKDRLYRFGDVVAAERDTRAKPEHCHRQLPVAA